ncbi:MAG: four helix bundle protein [Sphingobacteriales bacterium]|nr:MAG: four helix bundle protein [Sphingobacteriales bacterium]
MHNYKNLEIWKRSLKLAIGLIKETTKFPKDLKYGIVDQLRRAAISVPSNIAEGAGRNSNGQFRFFLQVSLGSCYELATQIEIAKEINAMKLEIAVDFQNEIEELSKMIFVFRNKLD